MILIPSFSRGFVTNIEGVARPWETAQYVRDCRSNELGWLVPRRGRVRISDLSGFSEIFGHKTVLLAVIDGILKWARIQSTTTQLTFDDFVDGGYRVKDGTERVVFRRRDDFVYISTGKASFLVEVPDLPGVPTVKSFYVPAATSYAIEREVPENTDGYEKVQVVIQSVYITEDQPPLPKFQGAGYSTPTLADRTAVGAISESIEILVRTNETRQDGFDAIVRNVIATPNPFADATTISFDVVAQTPLKISLQRIFPAVDTVRTLHNSLDGGDDELAVGSHSIAWDGNNDDGNEVSVGTFRVRFQTENNTFIGTYISKVADGQGQAQTAATGGDRTVFLFRKGGVHDEEIANYYDFYATRRDGTSGYYWIARVSNVAGQELIYRFNYQDTTPNMRLVEAGDTVHFQHITTNDFRTYAAKADDDRVYLSYYDAGRNIRLHQNFVDSIKLDLQGGTITGLHFIRNNLLIVYATNQIQIIRTDPLVELHSVIDFISPQDDNGNSIGCIAPDAIVDMGGTHWFLAANQYVYEFNSRSARTMSDLVRVMFQTMARPVDQNGQPQLSKAVAFAYEKDFYISIPSMLEENATDEPNTTLLYQPQYSRWWQDSFGVQSISKGYPERLYAIIRGELYELYEGTTDDGTAVRRVWRNNPFASGVQTRYESVHVYPQSAAQIDIKAITELETFETEIHVMDPKDIFSCRAGCNLRGRLLSLEIATESDAVIDRITLNENLRNQ